MRILAVTAAALLAASSAGAATIVNGSFEDGVALPDGGFTTLDTGDTTSITGWTVLTAGIDYIGTYWQASNGSRSLDLSAMTSGGVMQTINDLVVGQHYRVSFDVSANSGGELGTKRILVSESDGIAESRWYELTAANSNSNMLYQTFTYDFIAGHTFGDLQFRSEEFNPYGTVLDNVSISIVPEPTIWGLMIVGFASVGGLVRRRNRMQSTLA